MNLYDHLKDSYSRFFPLEDAAVAFVRSFLPRAHAQVLDAGCATGEMALRLSSQGCRVTAIDLNEGMIENAKARALQLHANVDFRVLNLLEADTLGSFDAILCFGNTLAHLSGVHEVAAFFKSCFASLHAGGYLIFQIMNFDRIVREGKADFPLLQSGDFTFARNYLFNTDGSIDFAVELNDRNLKKSIFATRTSNNSNEKRGKIIAGGNYSRFPDKKTSQTIKDTTRLIPLRRDTLVDALRNAGFVSIEIFADYALAPADGNEFASLYVAKR